jgi:hypothetical protein
VTRGLSYQRGVNCPQGWVMVETPGSSGRRDAGGIQAEGAFIGSVPTSFGDT